MNHRKEISALGFTAFLIFQASQACAQTRHETFEYNNNVDLWVLSQTQRVTVDGVESARIEYGWKALPERTYSYGKLKQTVTYNSTGPVAGGQLGTIQAAIDGLGKTTVFGNWKRGIPQIVTHHDLTAISAQVDDNGWIRHTNDEENSRTCYSYDALGRLSDVVYTSETSAGVCDESKWERTTQSFTQSTVPLYGLASGYWKQTTTTGTKVVRRHFDALWRVVAEERYDSTNVASTRSITVNRYDIEGRLEFSSYPVAVISSIYDPSLQGTWSEYDALGRTTSVTQDSELGPLTTLTQYISGFRTRVTNPRGKVTTTSYLTFDEPTTDWPSSISHPEGSYTHIGRDVFGKPTSIRRNDSASISGGSIGVNRQLHYNSAQELCKTIEPETGATLVGYDDGGNITWSAAGLPASTPCSMTGSEPAIAARRIVRTYDARNRVATVAFPDGRGNQVWGYFPDGLPQSITTYASSFDTYPAVNSYTYNRRRLMTSEALGQAAYGEVWSLQNSFNANGDLDSQLYPDGQSISYAPNALGQPTQVGSYASSVQYHPNGSLKSFLYGNGVRRTLTQNTRQLAGRIVDCATSAVACPIADTRLDLSYVYDATGNISQITDGRDGQQTRAMMYDGLDRLTRAESPMFGVATYIYNVLDSLTAVKVTAGSHARETTYTYDAENHLSNIKDGSGATIAGLGYDVQGNLNNKSGTVYDFDFGNRLREVVGKEVGYTYDGHGRRVRAVSGYMNPRYRTFFYSNDGKLIYEGSSASNSRTAHFYLAGKLIASRSTTSGVPGGLVSVSYLHSDLLGTPIATTSVSASLTSVRQYEPFGLAVNETPYNRLGFTGHVEDGVTGLTYMQQRYYDPQVGQFLSRDPVKVDPRTSIGFSAYAYARNNPYYYKDPDGRYECHESLTKEQCDQVRRANAMLKQAQQNATGNAKTVLTGVLAFLGEEGDGNGVVIKATNQKDRSGSWLTLASGGVLKLNFDSLNAFGRRSDLMVAVTLGHESWHGWWAKLSIAARSWDPWGRTWQTANERRAGITEALVAKGLGVDHPQGFYTRKGGFDLKAIDEQARGSVEIMCSESARSGVTCGP